MFDVVQDSVIEKVVNNRNENVSKPFNYHGLIDIVFMSHSKKALYQL